jgi:hypothetical protein
MNSSLTPVKNDSLADIMMKQGETGAPVHGAASRFV